MKRILRITLIVLLTVGFLALFLWKSNLDDVWRIMKSTDLAWFAAGLLSNFSVLLFRTSRWRTLLDLHDPPPFYPTFFANTTGYMLSTVLPVRAGDVARPALLARRTNIRFSTALGSVLTERILDLYSLLFLFVYYCLRHWNDFPAKGASAIIKAGAIGAAVVLALLTFFIVGLYFFASFVRRAHEFLGRVLPRRFRASWMHFFDAFVVTLRIARYPGPAIRVLGCTAGIWFCLSAQFWLVLVAVHRPLPFDASFFIGGLATLGLAIPTPGGVGGFHKACQLVLTTFYGFDIDSSVAVAVLFHIVGTLPVVVTGAILFLREGVKWRDLKNEVEGRPLRPPG